MLKKYVDLKTRIGIRKDKSYTKIFKTNIMLHLMLGNILTREDFLVFYLYKFTVSR